MPVKNKKNGVRKSTQAHLPIGEIRNNVVVLKNGGIRAVIKTSTINFNLKSEDEQYATLEAYKGFLNTLSFPIQIVVQSRKVDLDSYFQQLEIREKEILNPLLKQQTKDYKEYLKKLVDVAEIMEKEFFVVVPADPKRKEVKKNVISQFFENMSPEDSLEKVGNRYREFKALSTILQKRVDTVSAGLERCGLRTEQLSTQKLIDVYYKSYNPSLAQSQKIGDINEYNLV
jgi:hypothetical protein